MLRVRSLLPAVAVFLLASFGTLFAQTNFAPGSEEVDQLIALYRDAGRVFPVSSFPVSKSELATWAQDLAANSAGAVADQAAYYQEHVLQLDTSHDLISAAGAAAFEYYYRSQNVSFDPGLPADLQVLDVQRLFLQRQPLGALQLDYSRDSGGFELGIAARIEREYFLDPFHSTNLWESNTAAGDPVALENQDIMRGFLWYDFHPLQIELGRDKVQLGPGTHSLLLSQDIPFLDMLRLRLPIGRLTGDLIISTLENRGSGNDVPDPAGMFGSSIILMALHRYEYAFDKVRVGVAAMCVYARNGNAFNLGDIFPVFSWHQADIGPNNTILVADASWAPLPGLTLSGQFGLDDVNLSGAGIRDGTVPTIPAGIATVDYLLHLPWSLNLGLSCEAGYTHYLWGNFALDASGSNSLARAIDRYRMDGGNAMLPLTSPYGPGATWVELAAVLHGLPWLDASFNARYFSRMTDPAQGYAPVNLVDTVYGRSAAIERSAHVDTWSVGAGAAALPFGFLRLSVEPTLYVQIDNRTGIRNAWIELSLSAGVHGETMARLARGNRLQENK